MNLWAEAPESKLRVAIYKEGKSSVNLLFQTIPPERVGIDGEYDHNGLAKRVKLALCEQFAAHEISQIRVTQRGRVVILMGTISNRQLLTQAVDVASAVYGTAAVETQGVAIRSEGNRRYPF